MHIYLPSGGEMCCLIAPLNLIGFESINK